MTNKVILSIKGVQHEFGEDGVTEVITTGNYYLKNGKHYILYDEVIPETGEQISNTLKMTDCAHPQLCTAGRLLYAAGCDGSGGSSCRTAGSNEV